MDQHSFSDQDPTMVAKQTFQQIIEQIQVSNLNFQLELSPFSARISLRKSLVKDKFGNFLFPQTSHHTPSTTTSNYLIQELEHKNSLLIDQNELLQEEIKKLQISSKIYAENIQILEEKIGKTEASALKAFENQKSDTVSLKRSLKTSNSEVDNLKKEVSEKNKLVKERKKNFTN